MSLTKKLRKSKSKVDSQNSAKKLSFSALPLDTIIRLLWFLEPRDILALRLCCKTTYRSTTGRSVWIDALSQICLVQRMFMPTFSPQSMSRRALEYAAASKDLFASRLLKANMTKWPLPPTTIRVLPCHPKHAPFVQLLLIPGGRYLITTSTPNLVELWDLGECLGTMPNEPVAKGYLVDASVDEEGCIWLTAQPTTDGLGLKVIVIGLSANSETNYICLYEVCPTSDNPQFRLQQILELTEAEYSSVTGHHMTTDKLVFCCDKRVIIWDFSLHVLASIIIENSDIKLAMYLHDFVVLCRNGEFFIYQCPPFEILSTDRMPDIEHSSDQFPILRITCSLDDAVVSLPLYWYDDSLVDPLYYFNVLGNRDDDFVMFEYVFRPMQTLNCPTNSVSLVLPHCTNDTDIDINPAKKNFFSVALAGGHKLLLWLQDRELKIRHYLPGYSKYKSGCLWKWSEQDDTWDDQQFSLCPLSGRLCVLTGKQREIRILDFVRQPPLC